MKSRKMPCIAAVSILLIACFIPLSAQETATVDTSYITKTGERVLRIEMEVPVPIDAMWRAWTTEEGLKHWVAPVVALDFKVGGSLQTNYDAQAKIGAPGTIHLGITNYLERQLITLKVNLTDTFAKKARDEDRNLQETVQFIDLGNGKTKLISSMMGWGTGKEWDDTYSFFARGNKWTCQQLAKYLLSSQSTATEPSRSAAPATPEKLETIKAADFSWMTGRWIGHLADAPAVMAEQICSQPQNSEMLCLFRLVAGGRPVMFELYSMQDTPVGVELRSLHFSTDLNQKEVQPPLVMRLSKYSAQEVVFSGVPGSEVATSTLMRDSSQTMNGAIVMTDPKQGQIHVRWEKVDYGAALK
jgi:uncharacterized protein YndB with AHSA1/START domain